MKRVKCLFWFFALMTFSIYPIAQDSAIVRYLEGKAYVQGVSSEERELLTINSPIFEGDNVWITEGNMGILFKDGTLLWLSSDSHIEISQFPYPYSEKPIGLKASLWRGLAVLEAKFPVPTESSHIVITPSATIRTARKSLAIIEVENVDRTRLTVLDGSAIISSGGYSKTVWTNQMSYAQYGYEPFSPVSVGKIAYPEIVLFREKMTNRPVRTPKSWEYLDPELQAYAIDLDYYGYWEDVPGYGHVWFPSPAFVYYGWNPYFNGYWRYTNWGCTWISYEPWGWVPFHYGNWTYIIGIGWGWMPSVWFSPAWVAWYWWDGWIGWCPWGYYNGYWGPIWQPCGWYKIDITNIYVTNVTKVVVVNKDGPPPVKPVISVPKKAYNADQNFYKKISKDGDILLTHSGGLNIPPKSVKDIKERKIDFDDIRPTLADSPKIGRKTVNPSSLDKNQNDFNRGTLNRDVDLPVPSTGKSTPSVDGGTVDIPRRTAPTTRTQIDDYKDNPSSSIDRREPTRSRDLDTDKSITPPVREAPSTRDIPQRETPQRNNTSRESPKSFDSNRSGSPSKSTTTPPPSSSSYSNRSGTSSKEGGSYSPPPSSSSSSSSSTNKSNKHHLSKSTHSQGKIINLCSSATGKKKSTLTKNSNYLNISINSSKDTKNRKI